MAAARLARCREVVTGTAAEHKLPPENLIAPDSIRRLAWTPPEDITPETVAATLRGYGARAWQVGLIADDLAVALDEPAKSDPPAPDPTRPTAVRSRDSAHGLDRPSVARSAHGPQRRSRAPAAVWSPRTPARSARRSQGEDGGLRAHARRSEATTS